MKAKIFLVAISFILMLSTTYSFSQIALNEKRSDAISLKSFITDTADINNTAVNLNAFASDIKVQRSFISYFGEAAENNWSMVGKDYLNRFHFNDEITNALFSKQGKLIYTITYGNEKNMPADVRKIVKSAYYDYTITMAIEVKENHRNICVVKLDNALKQITVRIEDGEIERVQEFQKSLK